MATPDQIPTDLTIDLGDDLSPDEFVAIVRSFMGFVDEITGEQNDNDAVITWKVRVREGSVLIGVEPSENAPGSRVDLIYKKATTALKAVAEGDIEGSGLTEKGVNHLKKLSSLAGKRGDSKGMNIWIKRQSVSIDSSIAKEIQEDWQTSYYDFGTVEGRLEVIEDASGSLRIHVRDILYPHVIKCFVSDEMIQQVLDSFRRRVEIEGKIHYRRNGTPISIKAQVIEVLPEDSELPKAADVRGIMAVR